MFQVSGSAFGDNRNIHDLTELFAVISEELSNPAFESIPANRITDLATHGYTQAGNILTGIDNHNKMGRVITSPFLPGPLVFAGSTDPANPGEGLFAVHPMVRCYLLEIVAAKRLRPLARRRLITFAPDLERIRLRKPCVRLREILLGWNVRFMILSTPVRHQYIDFCEKNF